MNSLPKTVTRRRRGCDLNPGPSAPESSTLTTRLPSHPNMSVICLYLCVCLSLCKNGNKKLTIIVDYDAPSSFHGKSSGPCNSFYCLGHSKDVYDDDDEVK